MRTDKEKNENIYSTLDSYQAGFLTLRGHTPKLIEQGNKVVFVFTSNKKFYKDLSDYNNGAMVEADRFALTIKSLKSQIFSLRRRKENDDTTNFTKTR